MRTAVRAGLRRGWIEFRQSFTNGPELLGHFLWPALTIAGLFFLRDREFGGFTLGALILPSILGMNAAMGMVAVSQQLTADRGDGTLLRAKATPYGMVGYLVGKVVSVAGSVLVDLVIVLVPGLFIVGGLSVTAGGWLTLSWVLTLGLVATLPIGAVLGSVFTSAPAQGLIQLPMLGFIAISGIFYPITALPAWLEWLGQLTPIYWMGLGMRSALLPPETVAVEVGQSWRHLETAGVLGLWAVAGLLLAPVVLRRMARRESGSAVAARRERALRRSVG
ncbi:ABC transporter permease [Kribbella sandramycini]|uniref:ABC transporter permease n=1 Tax=Kribbella sandramycini TaxID=60450 RepID=A0A7Y4NZ61_9ACTN|nr:ABC transporter permease [Kribbella sandramycini]MBB6567551.1 ABC-2 type transport system permease protein [Kribbella sandramycini]NOL39845.1 ABC transporter permease [Kribbella sandramycini]